MDFYRKIKSVLQEQCGKCKQSNDEKKSSAVFFEKVAQ
jgi:hypothetical protein